MSLAATEMFAAPLRMSPRLVSELGAERSTLRAAVQGFEAAVIVYVGGEIDACNDEAWRLLLSEASAFAASPQLFIVDVNCVDFLSCSALLALTDEASLCRERGIKLCLVSVQPSHRRIVAACGLGDVIAVYHSAAQILQLADQTRVPAC